MRAFVIAGPGESAVRDVPEPQATPGNVVVDVQRVGVCGTDVELFAGTMKYLEDGFASFPMRPGHEWCGVVSSVGDSADDGWLGRWVTGDTMLGCGNCRRCRTGRHHVCEHRFEIGVRRGFPGALAERLAVPVTALHALPDTVDETAGALVEPAGNSLRGVWSANLDTGKRVLVLGAGTIGLLAAQFARAQDAEVHLLERSPRLLDFARSLGFEHVWTTDDLPDLPFDAIIDCTNAAELPARAVELVEPGGRAVFVGIAGSESLVDTRTLVLKDVTAVGILGAAPALAGTIELFASGAVDPRPLVAATVGLDDVGAILAGHRPPDAGPGPKFHIDPHR